MSLQDFAQIVGQLLGNYFSVGWPFLIVHAALAVAFGIRYWKTHCEVEELAAWMPGQQSDATYTSARILAQFVSDCERHGERGSLIPMTDYSDRLDAHIEHTVAALATRANLFLIVGVMGTFFALFQFAFQVESGLPPETIGRRLSQGLASAFPIGFVGLVLTMLAHLATDLLEGRFRRKAEAGVHRALATRSVILTTVESAILEAVEPLKNLEATLSRTLQPVIEGFRDQLRQTHLIMAEQVQPLAQVLGRLEQTTAQWSAAMGDFREASSAYYRLMRESAEIGRENLSLIKKSRNVFDNLDRVIQASAGSLIEASNRISAVPQVLSDRLAETMDSIAQRVEAAWQESSRRLFADLAQSATSLRTSADDLTAASGQLRRLPEDLSQQTALAIARQQDQFAVALAEMQSQFARASLDMTEQAQKTWRDGAAQLNDSIHGVLVSDLQTIRYSAEQAREKLVEGADSLITFADYYKNNVSSLIPEMLRKATDELMPYLSRLDQAVSSDYPRVLENLYHAVQATERFQQHLSDAAQQAERIHRALDGTAHGILGALEKLQQVRSGGSNGDNIPQLTAELKSLIQSLPDRIVAGLARRDEHGEPILFVKSIPFWRKVL